MRPLPGELAWSGRALTAALLVVLAPWSALAQPAPQPGPATQPSGSTEQPAPTEAAPVSDETKQEARLHFEKGLALLREEAWAPALAEFLLSRQLFPTRVATNNAAIALRKLLRYDASLDMFETLLRDFQLPPTDRVEAQKEVAELRSLVGTIDVTGAEPGAAIVVSGESRGDYPPVTPIRVAAGTHVVRIFKEGFEPFETRVEVAGGQTIAVTAKLRKLTRSGRLRVKEKGGRAVDVVVDNVTVGQTPWEGVLAVGPHMVVLRGEGKLGTQPTAAIVKDQALTSLDLLAEELEASLRVNPTPPGASVWINAVNVGNGVWLGRLKRGNHRIEVKYDGFVTVGRNVHLERGQREVVSFSLDRDDDAPIWQKPPKVTIDAGAAVTLIPTLGGDVGGDCSGDCSRSLGVGALGMVHGGYELGSGFGFGLAAGYLIATQSTTGRESQLNPIGLPPQDANKGLVDDDLRLSAFLAGASAGYHRGDEFPFLVRLGAGVMVGELRAERSGQFMARDNSTYDTASVADSIGATYFYIDPEARIGFRFADHFELSASVQMLMLVALSQPKWNSKTEFPAGTDGIGTYPDDALMGSFVLTIAPGANFRYDF